MYQVVEQGFNLRTGGSVSAFDTAPQLGDIMKVPDESQRTRKGTGNASRMNGFLLGAKAAKW